MASDWAKGACPCCQSSWAPEGVSILIGIYGAVNGGRLTLKAVQCPHCGAHFDAATHEMTRLGFPL